jgi:homoserine kinase
VVPDFDLPTAKARAVLPASYSREDAVFNVQRASLLIAALSAGRHLGLSGGARRPLPSAVSHPAGARPGEILKLRAPGLLGCALSGAGPSILVFYERGCQDVCGLVQQIFRLHNGTNLKSC